MERIAFVILGALLAIAAISMLTAIVAVVMLSTGH